MSEAKSFDVLANSLNVQHNYFDGPNKFSDLYLAKFLDTSAKPFRALICPFFHWKW